MTILGHGIDLVAVARIAQLIESHGQRFLDRCFTESEQAYAASQARRRAEVLAARFAAKEAALKALGTGRTGFIRWTDFHVLRHPSGRPTLCVTGEAAVKAAALGITQWHLSLSHADGFAIASVIGTG